MIGQDYHLQASCGKASECGNNEEMVSSKIAEIAGNLEYLYISCIGLTSAASLPSFSRNGTAVPKLEVHTILPSF